MCNTCIELCCILQDVRQLHFIVYICILPGQQSVLHIFWKTLGPVQLLPPQEGLGLVQYLVKFCIPPPHVLLHGPVDIQELHPPSTTE